MTEVVREFITVAPDHIAPSPFQRRTDFDDDRLRELAESIRQHGLLQPVTVRKVGPPRECPYRDKPDIIVLGDRCTYHHCPENADGRCDYLDYDGYELICGERRVRAARLAGLAEIPAQVIDIDDLGAAELVATENEQRADLNPIERAETYRMLADLGLGQSAIAERLGIAQPTVANLLRLLTLPPLVVQLVRDGELPPSSARALLRWPSPRAQELLAQYAVKNGLTTRQLEHDPLPGEVVKRLVKEQWAVLEESYGDAQTMFTMKTVCADCPLFRTSDRDWVHLCFGPLCYHEKQAAAKAEREQRTADARAAVAAMLAPAAPTPAAGDEAPREVLLNDLPRESYEQLYREMAGCAETCPRRHRVPRQLNTGERTLETICLNPDCYRRLKEAERVAHDVARSAEVATIASAILPKISSLRTDLRMESVAAVVAYAQLQDYYPNQDQREKLQRLVDALDLSLDINLLLAPHHEHETVAALNHLATFSASDLLTLLALRHLAGHITRYSNGGALSEVVSWFLDPRAATQAMEEKRAASAAATADDAGEEDEESIPPAPCGDHVACAQCINRDDCAERERLEAAEQVGEIRPKLVTLEELRATLTMNTCGICGNFEPNEEQPDHTGLCLLTLAETTEMSPTCSGFRLDVTEDEMEFQDARPRDGEDVFAGDPAGVPESMADPAACSRCGLLDCVCCPSCGMPECTCGEEETPRDSGVEVDASLLPAELGYCRYCATWEPTGDRGTAVVGLCRCETSARQGHALSPFTVACDQGTRITNECLPE